MKAANPYQAPALDDRFEGRARFAARDDVDDGSEVRPEILDAMRLTRPWVKFLGIVGYVMSGLMVLGGLWLMVTPGLLKLPGAGAVGVVYAIMGAINLFPSMHLTSYATSIQNLLDRRDQPSLADALFQQKKFWRFVGILMLILLAFYGLCIGIVVIAAIAK